MPIWQLFTLVKEKKKFPAVFGHVSDPAEAGRPLARRISSGQLLVYYHSPRSIFGWPEISAISCLPNAWHKPESGAAPGTIFTVAVNLPVSLLATPSCRIALPVFWTSMACRAQPDARLGQH